MKKLLSVGVLMALALASCKKEGCTDPIAINYNPDADINNGSCNYYNITPYTIETPYGFPDMIIPSNNPMTVEGVALGEKLFHDKILSGDGMQACASCHLQSAAFSDTNQFSAGIDGFNFMINSSIPITDKTEIYAFGGRNFRDTDAYAFSRDSFDDGDNRSVPSLYPNGFTPRITSQIIDVSVSAGVRHEMANGWNVDFNNTYGKNNFHYYIKGSNNASMKDASPTDFDAGGHYLSQNTTWVDFNKYFDDVASGMSIAFGTEYRTENFGIFAGEVASYALYDQNGIPLINPAEQDPAQSPEWSSVVLCSEALH